VSDCFRRPAPNGKLTTTKRRGMRARAFLTMIGFFVMSSLSGLQAADVQVADKKPASTPAVDEKKSSTLDNLLGTEYVRKDPSFSFRPPKDFAKNWENPEVKLEALVTWQHPNAIKYKLGKFDGAKGGCNISYNDKNFNYKDASDAEIKELTHNKFSNATLLEKKDVIVNGIKGIRHEFSIPKANYYPVATIYVCVYFEVSKVRDAGDDRRSRDCSLSLNYEVPVEWYPSLKPAIDASIQSLKVDKYEQKK